jgi:lysophospholipase L1-like esterase
MKKTNIKVIISLSSIMLNVILILGFITFTQRLGGINYLILKLKVPDTAKYQNKKSQFESLPKQKEPIIFIGNSITEQGNWNELISKKCLNRGIGGDYIVGIQKRLDDIIKQDPICIFIMAGINDLGRKRTEKKIVNDYRNTLTYLNENLPNTTIFVQSVLPVNNTIKDTRRKNSDIHKLNNAIKNICSNKGLRYIDLNILFSDSIGNLKTEYSLDGIHLTGKGYIVWSRKIKDELTTANILYK